MKLKKRNILKLACESDGTSLGTNKILKIKLYNNCCVEVRE